MAAANSCFVCLTPVKNVVTPKTIQTSLLSPSNRAIVNSPVKIPVLEKNFELYFDGAAKNNQMGGGLAGAGAVLYSVMGDKKVELAIGSEYLGTNFTNNQAEYRALILALKLAHEQKLKGNIWVFGDSNLVVQQIQGRFKVRNAGLQPLYSEAKSLYDSFSNITINHVPREMNARADALANQAVYEQKNNIQHLNKIDSN